MSGIAGIQQGGAQPLVEAMLERLRHRGPDGHGIWSSRSGTLGATTLASGSRAAAGPFCEPHGRRALVWDGELYNFALLQARLAQPVGPDAELLLRLYEREGPSFLERLNGPFALAILDGDELILARDFMGQAPLYFGYRAGRLCFASEIKALQLATDDLQPFPPGHYYSGGELHRFEPKVDGIAIPSEPAEIAAQLRLRLERAVARRIAEVEPLGLWLSGGLDSSALAALACRLRESPVHTFSVGMAGAPDLAYAREVATFLGTQHHEAVYSLAEILKVLPQVIYYLESFDAPLVRSSVANYLVAELASRYARVVLSGEGGDELFAGYSYLKSYCEEELPQALAEAQVALHNTALQRVDRMAAAHSMRARACFLDPEVVAFANALPARWKIYGEEKIEKWILRKALEGSLPEAVLWRAKEKFWAGAGVADRLGEFAQERISDEEFAEEREIAPGFLINSKEELLYWRLFREQFPHRSVLRCLGRTEYLDRR
jgi:asparagine synthase (glutamine-hydrolysing)